MPNLAGAASTTVRDLLSGPPRRGRVVGVHPTCAYVVSGPSLVAVETADALGLPCAVRLGVDRSRDPLPAVRPGDPARVGGGLVELGALTVRVARWWAPRRARGGTCPRRADALAGLLEGHPSPVPVDAAVEDLLGLGPGLTPAGDDLLAGLLVGLHHHPDLRGPLVAAVLPSAGARTTALSAALLQTSAAGQHAPKVLDVADALAGHGTDAELAPAVERLLAVGHTSGLALAHGLLRAARSTAAHSRVAA